MAGLIVLTAHPGLRTPRRLVDAGRDLGVDVRLVHPAEAGAARRVAGARLLARPGTFSLLSVLRAHRRLAAAGAAPLQPRRALIAACDQWRTLVRAAAAGLRVPATLLVRRPSELAAALARVPGPPWFVKGRRGSQGTQVLLAATRDEAVRAGHLFWGIGASCLVQEDLRPRGRIERHLVVGGRLLASAVARPAPGEFRSNVHRGGRLVPVGPGSARAVPLAVAAVSVLGLPFAAVDAVGARDPLLIEVNASPGLHALERSTGRDLARELLGALLR